MSNRRTDLGARASIETEDLKPSQGCPFRAMIVGVAILPRALPEAGLELPIQGEKSRPTIELV